MCERELTFSLSPPLSHSSLLPFFFLLKGRDEGDVLGNIRTVLGGAEIGLEVVFLLFWFLFPALVNSSEGIQNPTC